MVEVKDGCTIVLQDGSPFNYICFDQRISYVAEGSAGGFFERLQQVAEKVRSDSEGKYAVELDGAEKGIITITNNLAIDNNCSIRLTVESIIRIIADARPAR